MITKPEFMNIIAAKFQGEQAIGGYSCEKGASASNDVPTSEGIVTVTVSCVVRKCYDGAFTPTARYKLDGKRITYAAIVAKYREWIAEQPK